MHVNSIELDFYRNYMHQEAKFSSGINLIYGDNAQGKTNLVEAIAYLAKVSSHRARSDKELIQFGVDHAFIKARTVARDRDFHLEATLSRTGRRQLLANGVHQRTTSEFAGIIKTVLFCPEDLSLIRDGAVARRRFLDDNISQLRPKYVAALQEYKKLYEHKTRILRDWQEKPSLLDALDEFSLRMAQTGSMLIHYRAHFVRKLMETAPVIHRDFSGGAEQLGLRYDTVKTVLNPEASQKEILDQVLAHQESHRQAEIDARQCLTGPHKDDLVVTLDGVEAKQYASQGQTRTATLSLKLGCREIFHQDTGEWPILLLDDVLSELDPRRQSFVLNRISGGQVFITCCEEDKLDGLEDGAVFRIQGGKIV